MKSGRVYLPSIDQSTVVPTGDPRWQLVQRIVASRQFARAPLLSKFLEFVCTETICGRQNEISEYQIGVHVFDRPKDYRTVEDNIVRNYARQLRRRLAEFFLGEGRGEPTHIEIPLGGYVPVFRLPTQGRPSGEFPRSQNGVHRAPALVEEARQSGFHTSRSPWWWSRHALILGLVIYSCALIGATIGFSSHFPAPRPPETSASPLWSSLFQNSLNTFIVPSDCGFNMLEDLSKKQVALGGYLKGDYLSLPLPPMDSHSQADLRTQQFTSFVDLQVVSELSRLPEVESARLFVRFPRDLRMDDMKNANVILIGSIGSNPWAEIAQRELNFRIVYGGEMQGAWVEDTRPQPGEAARYESHWNEPAHPTFAVVSYQPNLGGNGHILLVQGLDVAGTQAAADALLRSDTLAPILHAARQSNGRLKPFEVLLQSTSIESNAASTKVVAFRID